MRSLALSSALAGLVATLGCDVVNTGGRAAARSAPVPTAVVCADGPQLRQRSADDRRKSTETNSDQEKVVTRNRATFYASLALVADLKCKVTSAEADDALKPALDAARKAETTESFYERAVHWSEAAYIVTQVVPTLMKELPAQPAG